MSAASILKAPVHSAQSLNIRAGLEPYLSTLDRRKAAHLLRRTTFFGSPDEVNALVGRSATDVVDEMILSARVAQQPNDPSWANSVPPPRTAPAEVRQQYNRDNSTWVKEYRISWIHDLLDESFREIMTLFWHDHFVTEVATYRYAFFAHRYLKTLRTNCLQYFKTFVHQIGIDPSMLIYLNGNTNKAGKPNENYARELLELFTMGPFDGAGNPNYSEDDIKEISRALTGWIVSETTGGAEFVPSRHDGEPAEIFGTEGDYGYDEVNDLLFSERKEAIAYFIAGKLYRHFVYDHEDPVIVSGLASDLLSNNFAIFETVGKLLKSAHFFDEMVIGTKIKSPVEFLLQQAKGLGRHLEDPSNELGTYDELRKHLETATRSLGQVLLTPPDVAGWPGYHDWITTNSVPLRWTIGETVLFGYRDLRAAKLIGMAAQLVDANDPHAAFYLPAAIAEHLLAVELEHVDVPNVVEDFGGDLTSFPIPPEIMSGPAHVRNLAKIFLGGAPWYDWYLYGPGANDRLLAFVHHILQYPDYQLM